MEFNKKQLMGLSNTKTAGFSDSMKNEPEHHKHASLQVVTSPADKKRKEERHRKETEKDDRDVTKTQSLQELVRQAKMASVMAIIAIVLSCASLAIGIIALAWK